MHYKRVEFIFYAHDQDDLPTPHELDVLRASIKDIYPSVSEVHFGSSIDVVNVLVGLLLESRKLFDKSPQEARKKLDEWFRERDKILNSLNLNT